MNISSDYVAVTFERLAPATENVAIQNHQLRELPEPALFWRIPILRELQQHFFAVAIFPNMKRVMERRFAESSPVTTAVEQEVVLRPIDFYDFDHSRASGGQI